MENPFRINAIDEVEVKCARIREVEETKRVKIREDEITKREKVKEREETKRKDLEQRDTAGYITPRLVAALVALAGVITTGICYSDYVTSKKPATEHATPLVCVDKILSSVRECDRSDQKLETIQHGDQTDLICRCIRETPPAPSHS